MIEIVLGPGELEMLLIGLGWAVAEGALASADVIDLAVKLGRSRQSWVETYGPDEL